MRSFAAKYSRSLFVVILLVGLDVAISLPIMGATYRPFSWMSIAPADAATLYPVIQNVTFGAGEPCLSIAVSPGTQCVLQRSTNLLDAGDWSDVAATTATERVILLIDTNPVSRAVFYRVKQILGGTP